MSNHSEQMFIGLTKRVKYGRLKFVFCFSYGWTCMPTSCSGELLLGIDDMLAPSTGEKLFLADLGEKAGEIGQKLRD